MTWLSPDGPKSAEDSTIPYLPLRSDDTLVDSPYYAIDLFDPYNWQQLAFIDSPSPLTAKIPPVEFGYEHGSRLAAVSLRLVGRTRQHRSFASVSAPNGHAIG